jgi:serine protease Do
MKLAPFGFYSTIKNQQLPRSKGVAMRRYILSAIALLPLLVSFSYAAQTWSVDPPSRAWVFSSEEGGTGAYLGVDITDINAERMSTLKLKEEKGVEVTMVDQDAPAGKAGIKEHDVIVTMNGTAIESGAQLRRMIHETPAGRTVTFGLSRDGQPVTVKLQLADRQKTYSYSSSNPKEFHFTMPKMPEMDFIPSITMVAVTVSAKSGLTMENITPQLGEFFGVKNGNGVLVRSVEKGSRAEKAGFRAGDVIVKVNDQMVHDTSDFAHAVKSRTGDSVSVGVMRDKKEQKLSLELPEHPDSSSLQEESSDDADINADSGIELGELGDEIAKMRPTLELAAENARRAAEAVSKTFCQQQRKISERAETQAREQQRKLKDQQEKLKQEMKRMQQEMSGNWLDI